MKIISNYKILIITAFVVVCNLTIGLSQTGEVSGFILDPTFIAVPIVEYDIQNIPNEGKNLNGDICTRQTIAHYTCNDPQACGLGNTNNIPFSNRAIASTAYFFENGNTPYTINLNLNANFGNSQNIRIDYFSDSRNPSEKPFFSTELYNNPTAPKNANFSFEFKPSLGRESGAIRVRISAQNFQEEISTVNIYIPIIVLGVMDTNVPELGAVLTPNIPQMILHDPPGDNSQTRWLTGTTVCRIEEKSYESSLGVGVFLAPQIGVKGSAGVIVEQEFEASAKTTFSSLTTETRSTVNGLETCTEITQEFFTSNQPDGIGPDADLFIGFGGKQVYGIYESTILDANCNLSKNEGLVFAWDPDDSDQFFLTKQGILTDIETQQGLLNDVNQPTLIRTAAENQIAVWNQVLQQNDTNIANADAIPAVVNGYTFSGPGAGGNFTYSNSTTSSSSISFNLATDSDVALETVALIGASGVTGGSNVNFKSDRGETTTSTAGNFEHITYSFSDDDDDLLVIDAYTDPAYGSAIFRYRGGSKTSCPYEGGLRRDVPYVESFFQGNIASASKDLTAIQDDIEGTITLVLNICNNSETNETREYTVDLQNNDTGAVVKVGNTQLNNANNIYNSNDIQAGQCATPLVTIQRNSSAALPGHPNYTPFNDIYNDLTFRVYPICGEKGEADSTLVTARFGDRDGDGIPSSIDVCPDIRDAALDFKDRGDTTSDYVEILNAAGFDVTSDDFAFEAWIHPVSGNYKTIVSKGHGGNANTDYIFGISADNDPFFNQPGKLGLFLSNGSTTEWQFSNTDILQNTWTHVAVSVDQSGINPVATFYVNGVADGIKTYALTSLLSSGQEPVFIGRQGFGCKCNHFDGLMDDVAFWIRQINAPEVNAHMAARVQDAEPGLVAIVDFNAEDACSSDGTSFYFINGNNSPFIQLFNFELDPSNEDLCRSNWSPGRNLDSDGDGIGDSCDTYVTPGACPPNLDLTSTQSTNQVYSSGGYISSNQVIVSPAQVDYDASTEITLLEGFEVQEGAELHAFIDGCY